MYLHRDNETTEERADGIAIGCQFCGRWGDSHTLMYDGCECGAVVRMELTFEKGE